MPPRMITRQMSRPAELMQRNPSPEPPPFIDNALSVVSQSKPSVNDKLTKDLTHIDITSIHCTTVPTRKQKTQDGYDAVCAEFLQNRIFMFAEK